MESIVFNKNQEYNLSNEDKNNVIHMVENALAQAHQYAATRSFDEVGVTLATVPYLEKLYQLYPDDRICLFTGAGVSFTESKYYKSPGWWDLLMEIYGRIRPDLTECDLVLNFKRLREKYSHPWRMASFLQLQTKGDRFTEILCELLYRRTPVKDLKLRPIGADEDKRLPRAYLNRASTLNSVIAFCSSIRAIRAHACYEKNDKIQAVLTLNYDSFLEAGATQKYNSGRFKPRISNEPPEKEEQLPVYHIHGYIPYGGRKPAKELVLTSKSYKNEYKPGGKTREILDQFLGKFSTLFIGISFDDELLLQRLEALAKKDIARYHFALLKQGTSNKLLNRILSANVFPILYSCHEQIPMILKHVYITGLPETSIVDIEAIINGKINKVGKMQLSKDEYWKLLVFNKT